MKIKCEIYRDSMQNYKKYGIRPAQLIIADIPYNVGTNFYGSNPMRYNGGDNKNGVNIGQNRLFAELRDRGFLIKRKGSDWNMPTQKSMDMRLFEIKETIISHADGHTSINKTVKVTGTGQQYFINLFVQEKVS